MPDLVQWSSALLALLGLVSWFWAAGMQMPRLKRQLRRVALCAALASALLQAAEASASTAGSRDVELWASAAPMPSSPVT